MKTNRSKHITVCGIGPGNPKLILPAVFDTVRDAEVLVGGKRHLAMFPLEGKVQISIGGNIQAVVDAIQQHENKRIVAVVSGDTGYHSFLRSIKKHLPHWWVDAVPGISSFQYLYARLGLSYENAFLGSVHGNALDIAKLPKCYASYFFLTDSKTDYRKLAQQFAALGRADWLMHVGNRLSYADEKLQSGKVSDFLEQEEELNLCSVIIEKKTDDN